MPRVQQSYAQISGAFDTFAFVDSFPQKSKHINLYFTATLVKRQISQYFMLTRFLPLGH